MNAIVVKTFAFILNIMLPYIIIYLRWISYPGGPNINSCHNLHFKKYIMYNDIATWRYYSITVSPSF